MRDITGMHLVTFKTNPPRMNNAEAIANYPKRTGLVFGSYDKANQFINVNFKKLGAMKGPIPLVRVNV